MLDKASASLATVAAFGGAVLVYRTVLRFFVWVFSVGGSGFAAWLATAAAGVVLLALAARFWPRWRLVTGGSLFILCVWTILNLEPMTQRARLRSGVDERYLFVHAWASWSTVMVLGGLALILLAQEGVAGLPRLRRRTAPVSERRRAPGGTTEPQPSHPSHSPSPSHSTLEPLFRGAIHLLRQVGRLLLLDVEGRLRAARLRQSVPLPRADAARPSAGTTDGDRDQGALGDTEPLRPPGRGWFPTWVRCVRCGAPVKRRETLVGKAEALGESECLCARCVGQLGLANERPSAHPWRRHPRATRKLARVAGWPLVIGAIVVAAATAAWWWRPRAAEVERSAVALPPPQTGSPQPAATIIAAAPTAPPQRDYRAEVEAALARNQKARPLEPDELRLIKGATVLVVTTDGQKGSGFLLEHSGRRLIATNHHVVHGRGGRPQTTKVIFHSGTSLASERPATLLAASAEVDLAVLEVPHLPADVTGLSLSGSDDMFETQPLVIAGFPFGEMLDPAEGLPTPTISTGTVTSLRRDGRGRLVRVQLDADLNPGNSGGPVFDYSKTVVGIAVETVATTDISFMVPVSALINLLASVPPDGTSSSASREDEPPRLRPNVAGVRLPAWHQPKLGRPLELDSSLTERARIRLGPLGAVVADPRLAADRRHLYLLNTSDGEVLKVDLASFRIARRQPVGEAEALALSPSGQHIWVAVRDPGPGSSSTLKRLDHELRTVDAFGIPGHVAHLEAMDLGLVFASLKRPSGGVLMIDTRAKSVVASIGSLEGAIRVHPDQSRLYGAGMASGIYCALLGTHEQDDPISYRGQSGPNELVGELELSSDARLLLTDTGALLRLSHNRDSDLRHAAEIPPWTAAAFAPGHDTFFAAHENGTLVAYSSQDVERPLAEFTLPLKISHLVVDVPRRQLVVVGRQVAARPPWSRHESFAADLFFYSFAR